MIGGVVIHVYIIVVQGKTVRPRATIIGVEDNEIDYLFRHLAFGVTVQNPSTISSKTCQHDVSWPTAWANSP